MSGHQHHKATTLLGATRIHATIPFGEARGALEERASGATAGKLALRITHQEEDVLS